MEILEESSQNNDIVFFEDGSWEAIAAYGWYLIFNFTVSST